MQAKRPGLVSRFLQFLGLRKPPPDIGVREPRRPRSPNRGGAATLELPRSDERD